MINSTMLMQGLVIAYLVIAVMSAYEGNWPRFLYWISATSLTVSILWISP